ncbi:hypothetical protein ElyMa_006512600 [Elysia marginata]|uniref:Uncharacterized protein n=1 Tax=Elysia marginata TaxID=1093978 RepID=A0AAV4I7K6_9GAST|nr:hypothetical protein ElyMa_006512600 [Elysia marginata]
MLFHLDRRPVSFTRQLLKMIVVLLLVMVPSSTARLFKARSKDTGNIVALLDVEFTLRLTAEKGGQQIGLKQLTENDVYQTGLREFNKYWMEQYFFFKEPMGRSGVLALTIFHNLGDTVSLNLNFDLFPDNMFERVHSELDRVTFAAFGSEQVNIGDVGKSYLCKRTEKIPFEKTSKKSDSYKYSVNLETKYFHFQAFTVQDGKFSPEPPTSCEGRDPSPGDSNPSIAIIAGSVAGGVVLLALIVLVVVLVVRYKRRQTYNNV